jgi:PEP-CTERM motif
MRFKKVSLAANTALLAATCLAATPALAVTITYTGTRTLETATINLSITTDGTLGTLTQANITDWTVTTIVPPNPRAAQLGTETFVLRPSNSRFDLVGNNMSASSTKLNYDFGTELPTFFQFVEDPDAEPGINHFWGADTAGGGTNRPGNHEFVFSRTFFPSINEESRNGFGVVTLATAPAVGAVPEPASWAMLIAGFGIAGAAMRRRRVAVAA